MEEAALLLMCFTMFLGSYSAGFLPLYFSLNEKKIRMASIFGAGLLVGTALCVIIPEGISALYKASSPPSKYQQGRPPIAYAINDPNISRILPAKESPGAAHEKQEVPLGAKPPEAKGDKAEEASAPDANDNRRQRRAINPSAFDQPLQKRLASSVRRRRKRGGSHEPHQDHHQGSAELSTIISTSIGLSLTIGFLFMFLVEHLSKLGGSARAAKRGLPTTTLGLVIHAAADGIALGSASTSSEGSELQLLVFFAIMLHKAPTAFALVSFLMLEGLEKARARKHLLCFSLSAPISALLTYYLLIGHTAVSAVVESGEPTAAHGSFLTGEILLFSGGTFLYVAAAHVLPELAQGGGECGGGINHYNAVGLSATGEALRSHFTLLEMLIFCLAALLPSFISSHFGHEH